MGIPTFFKTLIKKYPNILSEKQTIPIDNLYIDFNGIIYTADKNIRSTNSVNDMTINTFERKIINEVIRLTKRLINDFIKPKKLVYIAFDGPAPKAKMVQQRSRRFKSSILDVKIRDRLKKKYNIDEQSFFWSTSCNASPGTLFMEKLSKSLKDKIINNTLINYSNNVNIIYSDSNVPGEAEHKYMDLIRTMDKNSDESICINSGDGDVIVLAMSLLKKNTYIFKSVSNPPSKIEQELFPNAEYLYINVDILRDKVYNCMLEQYSGKNVNINMTTVIYDFVMLTLIFGNDFVHSVNFLKIRNRSYDTVINYYKKILNILNRNLINVDLNTKTINVDMDFLRLIFYNLSNLEVYKVKEVQIDINKCMEGKLQNKGNKEYKSEYERDIEYFQHKKLCEPVNPLFDEYGGDFSRINYDLPQEQWKEQYYNYFTGISRANINEYNSYRKQMSRCYIESLLFCINYYLIGVPTWTWAYEYRVPPMPSDVYFYISKINKDINGIKFNLGVPYTPFQQLMYILPAKEIENQLPKKLSKLVRNIDDLLVQYYPTDFKIDAVAGEKYIYSEAILPEIDEDIFIPKIREVEKTLTSKEKNRNTIIYEPLIKINDINK